MYVPHALDVDGQIVTLFDPIWHRVLDEEEDRGSLWMSALNDRRWVRIQRPVVVVGGELTLDMLDLTYNESSRYSEAPLQLKANGGVLLVDDKFEIDFANIVAEVKKITPQPIKYVVNTHHHGDHSGGNAKLQAMGDSAIGLITMHHYNADLDNAENKRFVAAYAKKHNARPTSFAKPSERGAFSSAVMSNFPCDWPAGILMPAAVTPRARTPPSGRRSSTGRAG